MSSLDRFNKFPENAPYMTAPRRSGSKYGLVLNMKLFSIA